MTSAITESVLPQSWERVLSRARGVPPLFVPDALRSSGLVPGGSFYRAPEAKAFRARICAQLESAPHAVLVTGVVPEDAAAASVVIGSLLGNLDYAPSPTLGGAISEVVSAPEVPQDQAWHTDSTPWIVPNRWTVLGMLEPDQGIGDSATAILPWDLVFSGWPEAAPVAHELEGLAFEWRAKFPLLESLRAPIFGSLRRWFRPCLETCLSNPSTGGFAALSALDRRLQTVQGFAEATIRASTVLVLDNSRVVHRGPQVRRTSSRRLIRVKVAGVPE